MKMRRTILGGSRRIVLLDDVASIEKLEIYDKGVELDEGRVSYRSGDTSSPRLETREALEFAITDFAECILTGKAPISDGLAGLFAVTLAEAATRSMREGGRPIDVQGDF